MNSDQAGKELKNAQYTFVAILCGIFLFIGLALGHTILRSSDVRATDWVSAMATIGLFFFAFFSWQASHDMQRLQERFQQLQERFVWFIGAMESHTDLMSKLLAKQQGIPVIWWDPKVQELPVKPKHGDIWRAQAVYSKLPVKLRGSPENKVIDVDALLRKLNKEKQMKRRTNSKRKGASK